ncbi:hypothetical protein L4C34_14555 [Vibrio profundum]|uniref:hypothetical protein n=1 Tax=Vibrio profundum TaxID=2910247 RepID=UPI003D10A9F7
MMTKKISLFFVVLIVIFISASLYIFKTNDQAVSNSQPQSTDKHSSGLPPHSTDSIYTQKAKQICNMMVQSYALLGKGKVEDAQSMSSNAYWDIYDGVIEIKYRSYASPSEIYDVEQKFHTLTNLITNPMTQEKEVRIKKKMDDVCSEVMREADLLNTELNGTTQVAS